jgi:hypothetical protein
MQQKVSGKDRLHQPCCNLKLHVAPSKEANKKMIAAATKFFIKAKEMDKTFVQSALGSSCPRIEDQKCGVHPSNDGSIQETLSPTSPTQSGWRLLCACKFGAAMTRTQVFSILT